MNSFVNAFRCAANGNGKEVVIQFLQSFPTFDEQTTCVNGVGLEQIASVVMSRETTCQLVQILQQMLQDSEAELTAEKNVR